MGIRLGFFGFLNNPLDERLRLYASISLRPFESEMLATIPVLGGPDGQLPRMHWDQLFMGLKPSPCLHLGSPLLLGFWSLSGEIPPWWKATLLHLIG